VKLEHASRLLEGRKNLNGGLSPLGFVGLALLPSPLRSGTALSRLEADHPVLGQNLHAA